MADEHRHPAASRAQGLEVFGQPRLIPGHVKPALGRALFAFFGDKADRVGFQTQHDRGHLIGRGAFEVQGNADACLQRLHIGVADVAAVFAQMGGDAVSARGFGQQGGAQRVRPHTAARVAHGCHMVDVHTQAQLTQSHPSPRYFLCPILGRATPVVIPMMCVVMVIAVWFQTGRSLMQRGFQPLATLATVIRLGGAGLLIGLHHRDCQIIPDQ